MAQFNAAEDDLSFFSRVLTFHVPFKLPQTQQISFEGPYSNYFSNHDVADCVGILERSRNEVFSQSSMRDRDDAGMIAAVDQYSPYGFQLMQSVLKSSSPVTLKRKLEFQWTGGLATTKADRNKDAALMFDLCMIMSSKALALANLAALTVPEYGQAISMLKDAAGIFDYFKEQQLPSRYGIAECDAAIEEGFSLYFLCRAQMAAVAKAITGPDPKYSLLAKLCMGAQNMLKRGVDIMRSRSGGFYAKLSPDLLKLFSLFHHLTEGLAFYCLSKEAYGKLEVGDAVAYLQKANSLIRQRANITSVGFPELEGYLRNFVGDVGLLRAHCIALEQSYAKDNSDVYFLSIPNINDLEAPNGVVMMQATPFPSPDSPVLPLLQFHTSPGPGGIQRSDSDLARELQEKLNTDPNS